MQCNATLINLHLPHIMVLTCGYKIMLSYIKEKITFRSNFTILCITKYLIKLLTYLTFCYTANNF